MTYYGWDADQLALALTPDEKVHYVYLPESFEPVLQERTRLHESSEGGVTAGSETDGRLYFYHLDHLGTPLELTDQDGAVAWDARYRAWGQAQEVISEAAKRAGLKNPLRFQGQYYDEESGLHYNRFRYYDPELGRFISEDPIGLAGGLNTYQYAPNPVEWVDPWGLNAASDLPRVKGKNLLKLVKYLKNLGLIKRETMGKMKNGIMSMAQRFGCISMAIKNLVRINQAIMHMSIKKILKVIN